MIKMRIRSERVPRVGDKYCVTGDHEVLTDRGWIRFDELYKNYHKLNDKNYKIAQLNNGFIEYVDPIDIYEFDYEGKMYKLESQQIDFQVTADHMLYVKKRNQKDFELLEAREIYGKRVNYKKNGKFNGISDESITLNYNNEKYSYDMKSFLRLLGMYISDGFLSNNKPTIKINKERKMNYLIASLDNHLKYKLTIKPNFKIKSKYEKLYTFTFEDEPINEYLRNISVGALKKYLPSFVFSLDQKYANILLEALLQGDGSKNNTNSEYFYTSSNQLAEDVQRLTIHAGKSSTIKTLRYKDTADLSYKLNADCLVVRINSKKNEPQINHGHSKTQNGQKEEWVDYDGKVYCLQVPSNIFMMRYNKKNHWTGNCCYTPDHDVLTTKGWVPINELTLKHKVATLANGNTLEYHYPTELQEYDYDGKMYCIKSNQIDLMVTPNHNMYVGDRNGKNFKLVQAQDIYGKRLKYKKNVENWIPTEKSPYISEDGTKFILPGIDYGNDEEMLDMYLDMDAWLIFFGIWIAEGCTLRDWAVSFSTHKQRVKEALNEANKKLNFKLFQHQNKKEDLERNAWCYNDKRLVDYFKPLSVGAVNKSLPEWVWSLYPHQCVTLIKGMMLGDGHTMENGTERYDTSSTKLADDFQRLCLHAGYSCNKMLKQKEGSSHSKIKDGHEIKCSKDAWRMTIITTQNQPLVNKNITKTGENQLDSYKDYNGKIYCCSVKNNIIYVRRLNVSVWCGNSRAGQKGTCGITLRSEDMPISDKGIIPDIIINTCAIPSRMTIGQLFESITGKAAALNGCMADATPFGNFDIKEVEEILKQHNFESDGTETMYCGMTGKKMQARIFIGPTYYLRLKHMVLDKIHCLTLDHEVLTISGWKTYDQLTKDDLVATLNPITEQLTYENPNEILYYQNYEGKMIKVQNTLGTVNLNVTAKHRMYVADSKNSSYALELADKLKEKQVLYKKDASLLRPNYTITGFTYEKTHALICIIACCVGKLQKDLESNCFIVKKFSTIRFLLPTLLEMVDIQFTKLSDDSIQLDESQYDPLFEELSASHCIPSWLTKLSRQQSYLFIDILSKSNTGFSFMTLNRLFADQLQQIALHAGISADIKKTNDKYVILFNEKGYAPLVNKFSCETQEYDYSGPVFCLTIPNEIFYVRRKGIACWTGNSRSRGTRQLLTRQPPEGRAAGGGLKIGEMERDAMIAHGLSQFLKERLVDNSDIYSTYVCNNCGLLATKMIERKVWYCSVCKEMNTSKITIPYAFKLLLQELMSINILPRLMPKVNEFTRLN